MRIIDADKAEKGFADYCKENNVHPLRNEFNAEWIESFLGVQPTVEAEIVRHGKWIFIDETMMTVSRFECSVCKTYQLDPHTPSIMRYCPNCGAKMDGKEQGK